MAEMDEIVIRTKLLDDATARLQGVAEQIAKIGKQANVRGLRNEFSGLRDALRTVGNEFRLSFIPNLTSAGLGIGIVVFGLKQAVDAFKSVANEAKRVSGMKTLRGEVQLTQRTISTFIGAMKHESILPQQAISGLKHFGDQMQLLRRQVADSPIWQELQRLKGGPEFRKKLLFTKDDDEALKVVIQRMAQLNAMGEGIAARRLARIFIGFEEAARITEADLVRLAGKVFIPTRDAEEAAKRIKTHMTDTQIQVSAWGDAFKAAMFPVTEKIAKNLEKMTEFNPGDVQDFADAMSELNELIPEISTNIIAPLLKGLASDTRALITLIERVQAIREGGEKGKKAARELAPQPFGPWFDWLNRTPADFLAGKKTPGEGTSKSPITFTKPSWLGDKQSSFDDRWDDLSKKIDEVEKPLDELGEALRSINDEIRAHTDFSGSSRGGGGSFESGGGIFSRSGISRAERATAGGSEAPAGPSAFAEGRERGGRDVSGVDPELLSWVREGAKHGLPEGYTYKWTSGVRPGDPGYHGVAKAADLRIIDPQGRSTQNVGRNNPDRALYDRLALSIKAAQERLSPGKRFTYGGHFNSGVPYDQMHMQKGGISARNFDRAAVQAEIERQQQRGSRPMSFWGGYDQGAINSALGIGGVERATAEGTVNVNVWPPGGTRAEQDVPSFQKSGIGVIKQTPQMPMFE